MALIDPPRNHGAPTRRSHCNVEVGNGDEKAEWVARNSLAVPIEHGQMNGAAEADRQRIHRGSDFNGPRSLRPDAVRREQAEREHEPEGPQAPECHGSVLSKKLFPG